MKISTTHQRFADNLGEQAALEYPEHFLGPNWKDVLNFWIYLDTLSCEDFKIFVDLYKALGDTETRIVARYISERAAENIIGHTRATAAWWAVHDNLSLRYTPSPARRISPRFVSAWVTYELIGSHKLKSLTIFPSILNL
jgi:hypothetical protein